MRHSQNYQHPNEYETKLTKQHKNNDEYKAMLSLL